MRLLQFTDTHLLGTPGVEVRGVVTDVTLKRCIAHAARQHPAPDAVLLTGDLVQDDRGGYARVRHHFGKTGVPVHCLPGNHDSPAELRADLADPPFVHDFASRYDAWLIAMLDSTVAGAHHGHLTAAEIARLDRALAQNPDAYALICLHHHPVPHGSPWLDALMLDNAAELFEVMARHPRVRALLWGHVHQALDEVRGTIRLMGTPSTCMQFEPDAEEFSVDTRPPAYRWLELGDDGSLRTGIEWVAHDE
ncbi:MAG: phosphodiesterase [Steroidobacteraceae bacterium]